MRMEKRKIESHIALLIPFDRQWGRPSAWSGHEFAVGLMRYSEVRSVVWPLRRDPSRQT